jgi:formamidopyrimidine-DNA glycosylase
MPELAEVEVGRKILEATLVDRRLAEVEAEEDPIVLEGGSAEEVEAALRGARVASAHRHGKHLWLALDRRPWPLFHFGMTGAFHVPGRPPLDLESGITHDPEVWPPRFTKIVLRAEDGGEVAMTNARRLGRIRLRDDPLAEPPLSKLGFDPLHGLPRPSDFARRVRTRKVPLKALLLDQGFAAGVGNWLADEIAFQARIDPRRPASRLDDDEIERLRKAMRRVVRRAVEVDADKSRFPRTWLFHHRWGKKEGGAVSGGHAIEHTEIAGRTTAWVPTLQR